MRSTSIAGCVRSAGWKEKKKRNWVKSNKNDATAKYAAGCLSVNCDVFGKKNARSQKKQPCELRTKTSLYQNLKNGLKKSPYRLLITLVFFILKWNLRVGGGVWHSPWLTKLTHSTATHKTTEVVNVRLSAKTENIVPTAEASKHAELCPLWLDVRLSPPASLDKHRCFCFAPITSWMS